MCLIFVKKIKSLLLNVLDYENNYLNVTHFKKLTWYVISFRVYFRLQNSRFFFLKISKEIGKACRTPIGRVRWEKKTYFRVSAQVSLSVFSLVPDLLFDYSRVLEYAKIRTVLQSKSTFKQIGLSLYLNWYVRCFFLYVIVFLFFSFSLCSCNLITSLF